MSQKTEVGGEGHLEGISVWLNDWFSVPFSNHVSIQRLACSFIRFSVLCRADVTRRAMAALRGVPEIVLETELNAFVANPEQAGVVAESPSEPLWRSHPAPRLVLNFSSHLRCLYVSRESPHWPVVRLPCPDWGRCASNASFLVRCVVQSHPGLWNGSLMQLLQVIENMVCEKIAREKILPAILRVGSGRHASSTGAETGS